MVVLITQTLRQFRFYAPPADKEHLRSFDFRSPFLLRRTL
jgi:hypothetical protein